MNTRAILVLLSLSLVLPAACRRYEHMAYQPTSTMSVAEAKHGILRSLEEQRGKRAVANIEITDEKLGFSPTRGAKVSARRTVLYFVSLGEMTLSRRHRSYYVRVRNLEGAHRFYVVVTSPELAKRFMDAMLVMGENARRRPVDGHRE